MHKNTIKTFSMHNTAKKATPTLYFTLQSTGTFQIVIGKARQVFL